MATYTELRQLYANDALRKRVEVAVVIAASNQLADSPGTDAGRKWALNVFANADKWGREILLQALGANPTLTVAQFNALTDAQIQSGVDAAVANVVSAFDLIGA